MTISSRIEGLSETYKMLDGAPEAMIRAVQKASRAGGKAVMKQLTNGVPARWKHLAQARVKNSGGQIVTTVGLVNRKEVAGQQNGEDPVYDWLKCYWANYGTLEGRDPSHTFTKPVKHAATSAAKHRRNRTGEAHQNFFEKASEGWENTFMGKFETTMDKEQDSYFKTKGTMQ